MEQAQWLGDGELHRLSAGVSPGNESQDFPGGRVTAKGLLGKNGIPVYADLEDTAR